jgi:hypothetical protein
MTAEELNDIIARADQASPGPYTIDKMQNGEYHIYSKFLRCIAKVVHPLEHQQRIDAEFLASAKEDIQRLVEMVHQCSERIAKLEQVDTTYTPRDLKDAMRVIALQRERIALLARQMERVQKSPSGTRPVPGTYRMRPRRGNEAPAEPTRNASEESKFTPRVAVRG